MAFKQNLLIFLFERFATEKEGERGLPFAGSLPICLEAVLTRSREPGVSSRSHTRVRDTST